jgi:hypothetical protein
LVELQAGRSLEVTAVPGYENEIVANSRSGDQQIGIRDQLSLLAELATQFSEPRRHALIYRQNAHTPQECLEGLLVAFRVSAVVDALDYLAIGDRADGQTIG